MLNVADSRSVEISVTPPTGFCPTVSTRGAPPSITTTSLFGKRPITLTSAASAAPANSNERDATIRRLNKILFRHEARCDLSSQQYRRAGLFCHVSRFAPHSVAARQSRRGGAGARGSARVLGPRVHGRADERQRRSAVDTAGAWTRKQSGRCGYSGARPLPRRAAHRESLGRQSDAQCREG